MKKYKSEQIIGQLEKRKGGYFFLKVDAEIVEKFEKNDILDLFANWTINFPFNVD